MNDKDRMGHMAAIMCWVSAALILGEAMVDPTAATDIRIGFLILGTIMIILGADAWINN